MLERYGFEVGRAGVMLCPFHSEDTPSFKAYAGSNSWYCYGCGFGGSVIDFVMRLFHLNYSQAVVRIDNDFRLGLTGKRLDSHVACQNAKKRVEKEREHREWQNQYDALWSRYAQIDRVLSRYRPTERTAGVYALAMAKLDYLWYAIGEMQRQKDGR